MSTSTIHKGRVLVVLVFVALTWFLLQTTSAVEPVAINRSLSNFPHKVGEYRLSDSFQSSAGVLELLGVDDYIQYNYVSDNGNHINFYVGYYRAVGVEGSYHSPKNCIPGGGWGIAKVRKVTLDQGIEGDQQSTVSEMLIQNGPEHQVVLYWYQNRGRVIASEYWEKIYLVVDALLKGRRDGTFIRVMSYANDGDIQAAQERVQEFAEEVMVELENYLPGAEV
ncbi:MAG TPA: EpsI family protein [Desulfopila sp.]|nr:EpsI family protein [Desulfopila sp.]